MHAFKDVLLAAKRGESRAIATLKKQYDPLLIGTSTVDGLFDEELYQECICIFLECIQKFIL